MKESWGNEKGGRRRKEEREQLDVRKVDRRGRKEEDDVLAHLD